jgi:hypothetical protein
VAETFTWDASGQWAWLDQNPGAVRAARLKTIARASHKQALEEWCTRTGRESLQFRGSNAAFAALELSTRVSRRYRLWQYKVFGNVMPYRSPRAKAKDEPEHMMNLLRHRGAGYNISAMNSTETVQTRLTLPGTRILNRIKAPYGARYRREFLALDGAGQEDLAWVAKRANELFLEGFKAEIAKARKRKLKPAAA